MIKICTIHNFCILFTSYISFLFATKVHLSFKRPPSKLKMESCTHALCNKALNGKLHKGFVQYYVICGFSGWSFTNQKGLLFACKISLIIPREASFYNHDSILKKICKFAEAEWYFFQTAHIQ